MAARDGLRQSPRRCGAGAAASDVDTRGRVWDVWSRMSRAEDLPGYRRRIRVETRDGVTLAMLEDDIHALAVTLRHDGETVTAVETVVDRMPWTTCPGAAAKLAETFTGVPLAKVTARRDKKANCTHLHDLAVLAAAHAGKHGGVFYEILVSDPVAGERILEVRRDGERMHRWIERDGCLTAPQWVAGETLLSLRERINALEGAEREAARLLQWASLVAHGRTMPPARQSNAAELPPNCYTFQPERAARAIRNGPCHDFSDGARVPLAGFGDRLLAELN